MMAISVWMAPPSQAFIFVVPAPSFPESVVVGQTFPAALGITNASTPPESTLFPVLNVTDIDLVPACSNPNIDCVGGLDPGVFTLSATGTGNDGPSCDGVWTITEISPGRFRFTPPGGNGTLQLATGETCVVTYTATANRIPAIDVNPALPDTQTNQIASATSFAPGLNPNRNSGSDQTTVLRGATAITTTANVGPGTPGVSLATTTDSASVTPVLPNAGNGALPGGAVDYVLYGPFAGPPGPASCTAANVVATRQVLVNGFSPPPYTTTPVPITAAGTYTWVAAYSGDLNYFGAGPTACGEPAETFTVAQVQPALVTVATPPLATPVAPGTPLSDAATLSGGFFPPGTPPGTIRFDLYGPFPAAPTAASCVGAPFATRTVPGVASNGTFLSTAAPPPVVANGPGFYTWVATYTPGAGDVTNLPVTTVCGDPGETSVVQPSQPTIVTLVSQAEGPPGTTVTDVATISGLAPVATPPGTVTFTVFPNTTCTPGTGIPLGTRTVTANGNYTSDPFTPPTAGEYRFVASYSGDANNLPATTACGDPGESLRIIRAQPMIVTEALSPVTLTNPIRDTATLSGGFPPGPPGPGPTGTITFTLFGPGNPTCIPGPGQPVFTSTVPVSGNGTYTSADFLPTAPGSYQWVAVYSGDINNAPATSACGAPNETSVVTVLPTIDIIKTPNPESRPEPGGDFTYTVVVTNTSVEVLTITTLTDSVYGNLATRGSCTTAVGTVLPVGGTYTCAFTAPFFAAPGTQLTDVATVTAVNPAGVPVNDNDDAVVTITPVPPVIEVIKDVTPPSRPEPGGDFTYTVTIRNPGTVEAITITSLVDNVYGNLATRPGSTCGTLIGTTLAPGATSAPCTFTAPFTGDAGASLTDIVTATGVDDDGETVTDTDDAVVTLTDVLPSITVVKTADPLSRPEPGGDFNFTVVVTNTSIEPIQLTSLNDNVYGNLDGRGTCDVTPPPVLPANGGTYSCTFTGPFAGQAGASQTDIVTATGVDDDQNTVTDTDDAIVTITNIVPSIVVDKDVTPASLPEPGGDFTFTVRVTNNGNEAITILTVTDNIYGNLATRAGSTCGTLIGTVLQPAGSTTCTFTGPFAGPAGASQTDVVTVTGEDDDRTPVSDTDDAIVTITGVPPTIAVTKTASPASRVAPGGTFTFTIGVTNTSTEVVTITSLVDDIYGDLNGRGSCAVGAVLQPGDTYTCTFDGEFRGSGGAIQVDTVTAIAVDQQGNPATAQAKAQVRLDAPPPPAPIAFTGSDAGRYARLATGFVIVGLMMVGAAWRSNGGLALVGTPTLFFNPWRRPDPPEGGPAAFQGGPPG
ncbi:MAG: DUF11 domain-containing protein, partial [Actinobacteria bacterium]|nr:DUF11 domain-containing protein [Actinomycetota bacterium]